MDKNNFSTNQLKARYEVKNPHLVMIGLYLGGFIGMFSETALNIAIPSLSAVFGIDTSLTQWMVVGYMLMIGIILPFVSLMSKWISIRKLTNIALGSFLIGCIISGLANNFTVLFIGRMIQGIGTGIVLPIMFSLILELFPKNKIGSAMGICALVIMFAPAIGPTLAGIIIDVLSWRYLFFLFALILLIAMIFVNVYMVNPYEITKPKIDLVSCITSVLGFGGIVIAAGLASVYGWLSMQVILILLIGIISIIIYVKKQFSMENPILNLSAFKITQFSICSFLVMINFGITLVVMFVLPQYVQNGLLLPVSMTGMLLLPGGIVNCIVSLFAGKLYDKIGGRTPIMLGFLLSIVATVLFMFTSANSSIWVIIICHLIIMVGVPLAMSPAQSSGLKALPMSMSTDGSTILNTMQQVWGAVCTAMATSVMLIGQSFYTGSDKALQFVKGAHFGFGFALILAIIGFVVSFYVEKTNNK